MLNDPITLEHPEVRLLTFCRSASAHTTLQVMRSYLDMESVVGEKIMLHPASREVAALTGAKSEEQQTSAPIDCQLTCEVHYNDKPVP